MRTDTSELLRISVCNSVRLCTLALHEKALLPALSVLLVTTVGCTPQDNPADQQAAHAVEVATSASRSESTSISIIGTIEAHDVVGVSAPFDGTIKDKLPTLGSPVEQGQSLLTLDTAELTDRIQSAKTAYIKAANTLHELDHWEQGSEVTRAKRQLLLAQQQAEQAEHKVREAETLLQKGIIARNEFEGLKEQLQSLDHQRIAASDDLLATQAKTSRRQREIAEIELAQAKSKLDELTRDMARARITAPRTGIVTKAPSHSGQTSAAPAAGSRVTKGQLLFNIALTDRFRVSAQVDEVDVADLMLGMPVLVSVESQGMPAVPGRLSEIAAHATVSGNGSRSAVFEVKIDLPEVDTQQRRRLRLGMSCVATIEINRRGNAERSHPPPRHPSIGQEH